MYWNAWIAASIERVSCSASIFAADAQIRVE
jgi:hypothetical protein